MPMIAPARQARKHMLRNHHQYAAQLAARWLSTFVFTLLFAAGCNESFNSDSDSTTFISSSSTSSLSPSETSRLDEPTTNISFVAIPAGESRIGSVSSEPGRDPLMEPLSTSSVPYFEMSKTEITIAQWDAVMRPELPRNGSNAMFPKTGITWTDANQYCRLLSIRTGDQFRLPTEVEWEHACRASSSEMMSVWSGNNTIADSIRSYHRSDIGKLMRGIRSSCNIDTGIVAPIQQYPANAFGLYDMHGNVWEWVDFASNLSEPPSPLHAPIRGGSAVSTNPLDCRSANRSWQRKTDATDAIGFRIIRVGD